MPLLPVVIFEVVGGDPARLLTCCREKGLPLCRFRESQGRVLGSVPARQYKAAARTARACGCRTRVVARRGAAFILHRYRRRIGLFGGGALFAALLFFSQCFIWAIDIVPTDRVSEAEARSALAACGVRVGTFLPAADLSKSALQAKLALPSLSFLALSRVGSRIQVEMKDAVEPPPILSSRQTCNIIAARAGRITAVEAYNGSAAVKPGDYVREGDLLVSGIVETPDGKTLYLHASAKVTADVEVERSFSFSLRQTVREATGEEKKRYSLDLFGKKIPLYLSFFKPRAPFESSLLLGPARVWGIPLPFGLYTETLRFYTAKELTFSEEEALAVLEHMASTFALEYGAPETAPREEAAKVSGGKMTLRVVYTFSEDIAREQGYSHLVTEGINP